MARTRERRKLERFSIELPAKIEVTGSAQEQEILDLLTKDVSSGGAFFHTKKSLPVGTEVKIDLILPIKKLKRFLDNRKEVYINVSGTVLRSESDGMAIGFNEDYQFRPSKRRRKVRH
ncbi:MAG: PilZ domain-containing protein [Desulfobacteraceae bacterium]|jgi:hypothetical protein